MKRNAEKSGNGKMSLAFVIPFILFYLVVGILLLWLEGSLLTRVASYILSALLFVCGGLFLVRYLRSAPRERIAGKDLALGLVLLTAGFLLVLSPDDLGLVFPKIWGLSLIFGGFLKIQYAFDEKTVQVRRWWIMLIFAAVSLIIGILSLSSHALLGNALVIGIFMLGEAVLDLVTFFLLSRGMKRQSAPAPVPQAAPASVPQAAPAPVEPAPAHPGEE